MVSNNVLVESHLNRLIEGNKKWADNLKLIYHHEIINGSVENQAPFAVVITCADSRVTPEFIFQVGPGELFVIRIAGNIASPEVLASIEFAISELKTKIIIVLGHQNCGAIIEKLNRSPSDIRNPLSQNLDEMLDQVKIINVRPEDKVSLFDHIKENILYQANSIRLNSPLVLERVNRGEVLIKSAYYSLESKKVIFLEN